MSPRIALGLLALLCGVARADPAVDALLERYRRAREVEERLAVVQQLNRPEAVQALAEVLRVDPEERVRLRVVEALVGLGTDAAGRALLQAVDRWDPFVVEAVVRGLSGRGLPAETVEWILAHGLREGTPDQQAALVTLLSGLERKDALPAIKRAAAGERPWRLRAAAASALSHLDPAGSAADIRRLAGDEHLRVRVAALEGLERVPGDAAAKLLRKAARSDSDWQARLAALRALSARDPQGSRPLQLEVLKDLDLHLALRLSALELLEGWQDPRGVEARIEALKAADGRLELALVRSLQGLTAQPHTTHAQWKAWWREAREGWAFPAAPPPPADDPMRTRVRFYDLPIESSSVCFVLDASGSMNEPAGPARDTSRAPGAAPPPGAPTKWEVARKELEKALSALPEGSKFGLVLFSERVAPLQTTPVPASKKNVAAALALLDQHPPQGATDLHAPLALLFHAGEPDDPGAAARVAFDTLVLLSDGLPTAGVVQDAPELLRRVKGWNRFARVRIHTVGLGEQNKELLQGLARDGGGQYASR